ncbi:MAG: divalent cation tolerance protein CutA [Mycoplasmatota bacterium]
MDFRTNLSLYKKIEDEILKIHDYDVCEISYYEILGNTKFLNWIEQETSERSGNNGNSI